MISGQLLLTILVALLVFGPDKLPMLARHLGRIMTQLERVKQKASILWQKQLQEHQLQENTRKARDVDAMYEQTGQNHD